LVGEALEGGEDTLGQLRIELDQLTKGFKNIGMGATWGGQDWGEYYKKQKKDEPQHPKPKEWLAYSWQHNVKKGLITLFGGAGLAFVLYFLSRVAISHGTLTSIEEAAGRPIPGLDVLATWLWLFALIPMLKGVAQILYAAFFAESITTLAEKFMPPPVIQHITAPLAPSLEEAPPSVTEHTTRIFEGQPQPRSESQ
jgi:hypothetical protein